MPSWGKTLLSLGLALGLRWLAVPVFEQNFKVYPHFKTPLTDLRELKEMFYMYENFGEFFTGPKQIAQSELLLLALFKVHTYSGKSEMAVKLALAASEALSLLTQLLIFHNVFGATKKKEAYTSLAFYYILFNPMSIISGFSNLGVFNDTLFYMLALVSLWRLPGLLLIAFSIIVAYFDPRAIFLLLPITVAQARKTGDAAFTITMTRVTMLAAALSGLFYLLHTLSPA